MPRSVATPCHGHIQPAPCHDEFATLKMSLSEQLVKITLVDGPHREPARELESLTLRCPPSPRPGTPKRLGQQCQGQSEHGQCERSLVHEDLENALVREPLNAPRDLTPRPLPEASRVRGADNHLIEHPSA